MAIKQFRVFVKSFHNVEIVICQFAEIDVNNNETLLTELSKAFRTRDENLDKAIDAISDKFARITLFLFMTWLKVMTNIDGKTPSLEARREMADYFGYDWDESVKDWQKSGYAGVFPMEEVPHE